MNDKKTNNYVKVLEAFTEDELQQISQIKRFFECYEGDINFRTSVNSGQFSDDQVKRLKQIGIEFDLKDLSPLWENPDTLNDYVLLADGDFPQAVREPSTLEKYPLLKLWLRFAARKKMVHKDVCMHRSISSTNIKYEKWRDRRIAAAESELGGFNHFIDHPVLSFELTDGCSVQCWFCSFCAGKLKAVLDYKQNKDYFRDIVRICVDVLGKAAGLALLYYATEPYDNPDYINYMKDFADITGSDVCTSTAVCADKKWIDDLLAYYRPKNMPWPRLSILSAGMLRKVHDNFTPDELMHVNMIMQMKDSEREKVSGGKIFNKNSDMRERVTTNNLKEVIPQGTIACVSGFYVNLVNRVIRLVSPCYTSEKWPLGYRIFDEASFTTAEDFRRIITRMIERNMPTTPPDEMILKLRDDLVVRTFDDGFDLVSPNQIHHFREKDVFKSLGTILTGSPITFGEALDSLMESGRHNIFEAQAVLNNLFHKGFMDETVFR